MHAVFLHVQPTVWLPVFLIFNRHCTDVDACDCTQWIYKHCKWVCTRLDWINPFQHWGIEPDSVLCLAFWSDNYAVPVLATVDIIFAHTKTWGHSLSCGRSYSRVHQDFRALSCGRYYSWVHQDLRALTKHGRYCTSVHQDLRALSCSRHYSCVHHDLRALSISAVVDTTVVYTMTILWALLSGTFFRTLPDLVTPLKGHSLSPHSFPLMQLVPPERFGYW